MNYTEKQAQGIVQAIKEASSTTWVVSVKATFNSEVGADQFVDSIGDLDEENMFPNGAEVRRDTVNKHDEVVDIKVQELLDIMAWRKKNREV